MSDTSAPIHEQAAAVAFSKQAPIFDQLYGADTIIQYKRKRVREHVLRFISPNSQVLELNAGTGEDAIYFAGLGHSIHATDISSEMLRELAAKVSSRNLDHLVTHENISFTNLENLARQGPYDMVFSNFAGLNCTPHLEKVLNTFSFLVRPGGLVTLVILPKFCLWEFLMIFKGKFITAFRRFAGKKGASAHIEGTHFRCWYYNPSFVIRHLKNAFELVALEGLCTCVPPSYLENFAEKHPRLFKYLEKKEARLKSKWPWRSIGDYYIVTLRREID